MFGNNAVTSSWANPQPQQNQQTPAFGQPSTFGSTGTFGQPQQQPQTNSIFGGMAAPATASATPASGFGGFGGGTGTFGGAKPAAGFGAFVGGTTTFGSGGTFGTTPSAPSGSGTTGTNLFGQPGSSTGTSTFGTSALFGASKPATTFGATSATATENVSPVTTGSSTPWTVFSEKDPSAPSTTLHYQSITCVPVYRGTSFEELRLQDYQQGRKTAGAFGQSASFGTTPNTGIFGQAAQPSTTQPGSIFGAGGTFGNNPTQPAPGTGAFGGTFGQPATTQPATQGTGIFGGAYGQQQQQQQQLQPTPGLGTFGTQQQPGTTAGGLFGGTTFGGQQKPTFGTNTFGAGGTGTYGQTPQAGGLFGQPNQPQGAGTFAGAYGAKPSIFGGTQPATQTPQGLGMFGGAAQNQPQQQPTFGTGGLFGQNNPQQQQQQQQAPAPGGLFANTQAPQQPAPGGLFSGAGGLFGNMGQQQQQNQQPPQQQGFGGGLFGGNQPASNTGGGLFGGLNRGVAPTSNLFGGNTLGQNAQQPGLGGGLGGLFNKPAAPQLGTAPSAQMTGYGPGSLFGNTVPMGSINANATGPGAQGTLTASIAQPIAANLPIFSMLPPGPRIIDLEGPKKKTSFLVDVPTRKPIPGLGMTYRAPQAKIRGFTASQPSSSVLFSEGKPETLDMNKPLEKRPGALRPDTFFGRGSSPALGSGGKQSVKKLILDKKVDSGDLFNKAGSGAFRTMGRVSFSPALSLAAREREAAAATSSPLRLSLGSPTPTPAARAAGKFTAGAQPSNAETSTKEPPPPPKPPVDISKLEEGEYWSKPDLETLKTLGYDELLTFKDLAVGRVGYGEIQFLEPVDLTGLSKLSSLLGEVIRFDDKECSVYPDCDEEDKPEPSTALNVRARIILVRCWAVDKATREPIKDEKSPVAVKHLKRLKHMKDTTFESFEMEEGKWTFTVEHF